MDRTPSIRTYLILMNLLLLCLLFPAISIFTLRATSSFRDQQLNRSIVLLEESLASRAGTLASSLSLSASEAAAGYDFSFLMELLRQATINDPSMLHCLIMSPSGQVLADHAQQHLGEVLDDPLAQKLLKLAQHNFPQQQGKEQVAALQMVQHGQANEPAMQEVLAPVYNGGQLWGILRCTFSRQELEKEISTTSQQWSQRMKSFSIYLFSLAALFFGLGMAVVIFFTRPLLAALNTLETGVQRISNGDLQHAIRATGLGCREFAELASSFNEMTDSLRLSREQLADYSRGLEEKVEERTRALHQAQESLLRQAHEAGMAEMAVGVLHNIGNAITPAKVGTAMLLKRLRESPLQNGLAPALAPLQQAVLSSKQLSDDERQRYKAILELLPSSIQEEFGQISEEINRIREKHEHIEAIIGLQMRYARLMGKAEPVDINRVVRDALDMLADSLQKREIEVELELAQVPAVDLEKAKLIQVIVNIIKNSYEAIDLADGPDKKIRISSSLAGDSDNPQIRLVIADSGCGFEPAEQDNLFSFGYSTKHRGTGFGLHSCANFLIANNGSIQAESPGPGQGAQFILTLPISAEQAPDQPITQAEEDNGL